jgi:hypothetical protein
MATATKGKRQGSKARSKASAKTKKAGTATRKAAPEVPNPMNRGANAVAAAAHAARGTKAAGQALGALASIARKPLLIGGAAIAGVAGGLALSKRS